MTKNEMPQILVVGDIMLDKYIEGVVERISPEAPVPVVKMVNEYYSLGGCGNVVRNLREIGAQVSVLSSIGDDEYGKLILKELNNLDVCPLLFFGSDITTVKERIIEVERKTQMLRVDREIVKPVVVKDAIEAFELQSILQYDIILISDYAKGMISFELMQYLKEFDLNIIVDPKPEHGYFYDGVYMITPNEKEWNTMSVNSAYNLKHVEYIVNTLGSKGMKLINNKTNDEIVIPSERVQVYNVSGCGDVVVSVLGVCTCMGIDPLTSAKIANACAGYTATLPGTSVIPENKFIQTLQYYTGGSI